MVATAFVVAGTLSVAAFDVADEVREPAPEVAVDASFVARDDVDPHWVFRITHEAGDNLGAGDLRIRLVDDRGGSATGVYPERVTAGQTIRVGLWGSPSRASGGDCLVDPVAAPGAGDNQLDGFGDPASASTVRVVAVHEPSGAVMDETVVDLSEMPRRFDGPERHYLADGSEPSFGCEDVTF
jgi:hypothetical protein